VRFILDVTLERETCADCDAALPPNTPFAAHELTALNFETWCVGCAVTRIREWEPDAKPRSVA
jgi:hypothetical protein